MNNRCVPLSRILFKVLEESHIVVLCDNNSTGLRLLWNFAALFILSHSVRSPIISTPGLIVYGVVNRTTCQLLEPPHSNLGPS